MRALPFSKKEPVPPCPARCADTPGAAAMAVAAAPAFRILRLIGSIRPPLRSHVVALRLPSGQDSARHSSAPDGQETGLKGPVSIRSASVRPSSREARYEAQPDALDDAGPAGGALSLCRRDET